MIVGTFLSGVTTATFLASSVYFFKFWKASRDEFFRLFGIACALLGVERILLLAFFRSHNSPNAVPSEAEVLVYLVRAAAFILILIAFILRNRQTSSRGEP